MNYWSNLFKDGLINTVRIFIMRGNFTLLEKNSGLHFVIWQLGNPHASDWAIQNSPLVCVVQRPAAGNRS